MRWLLVLAAVGRLAAQCGIDVSPAYFDGTNGSSQIAAGGGTYTITISGNSSSCSWAAAVSTGTSWITLGQTGGTGPGVLTFNAALNPTNSSRTAAIFLSGGWTVPVVQVANTCIPMLPVTSASVAVGGGSGSFSIQTVCQWNVGSNANWITLQTPTNGTGNGSPSYTVAANGCVAPRIGTVTAYSGTLNYNASDSSAKFTINQAGSPNNLTLSPTSAALGSSGGTGSVTVTTAMGCSWTAYTDSQSWIQFVGATSGTGTTTFSYKALANTGAARQGSIFVGSAVFTISEQAAAVPVPQLTALVNAASYATGAIAPGEVVALGGTGLGPPKPGVSLQLSSDGKSITTTLGGVQVLFDGKYAAALTYVSDGQINAITPYEIAGETSTQIQVVYQNATSAALQAQVQAAAPGIFTGEYTGTGQGAILNQDYSVNGMSYPAAPGSTVMIFCSGAGATDPAISDAAITPVSPPFPALVNQPVTVTIGGIAAQVKYAGGAPGAVAGLTQINAVVPSNVATGSSVPVVIQIGTWQSQAGVTMVVR